METYTSETYTVKNLKRLLERHAAALSETDRHRRLIKDLELEEKQLLAGADINNSEQFKALGTVRTKRELAPRKVEQFETEAHSILESIEEECRALILGMGQILEAKASELLCRISSALRPFFTDRHGEAMEAAKVIFWRTNFAPSYSSLSHYLRTEGLLEKPTIHKAATVLELSQKVALLETDWQPVLLLWETISVEEHRDRELTFMLTDRGREEAIERLETKKMARGTAEKAIEGRISHLLLEWFRGLGVKPYGLLTKEGRAQLTQQATQVVTISQKEAEQAVGRRIDFLKSRRDETKAKLEVLRSEEGRKDRVAALIGAGKDKQDVDEIVNGEIFQLESMLERPKGA